MINRKYVNVTVLLWNTLFCADFSCSQQTVPAELDNLRRHMESLNTPPTLEPRGKDTSLQIQPQKLGPWSALKVGMTESEVQSLMGKPDRVEDRELITRWSWSKGKIWFSFDQQLHKVVAWGNL